MSPWYTGGRRRCRPRGSRAGDREAPLCLSLSLALSRSLSRSQLGEKKVLSQRSTDPRTPCVRERPGCHCLGVKALQEGLLCSG